MISILTFTVYIYIDLYSFSTQVLFLFFSVLKTILNSHSKFHFRIWSSDWPLQIHLQNWRKNSIQNNDVNVFWHILNNWNLLLRKVNLFLLAKWCCGSFSFEIRPVILLIVLSCTDWTKTDAVIIYECMIVVVPCVMRLPVLMVCQAKEDRLWIIYKLYKKIIRKWNNKKD